MSGIARKALIFITVMTVVATAGWFGRKAYKKAAEHRLLAQASQYMQKKDLRNTALCLQRAWQVNPLSPAVANSMGDMLESAGIPAALGWRVRAAELNPKDVQLRFAWAETALKLQDLRSADTALAGVDQKSKSTATYHKLLGALAWGAGHRSDAETNYLEALRLEPSNPAIRLNLATIHLASTNEAIAGPARLAMEQMTTNSNLRLTALHYLMADALAHKSIAKALSYSQRIVQDPAVTLKDKIEHLQLLQETKSPESAAWLASLKTEATQSPVTAFALGQWMATADSPTNALRWLQTLPAATQTNQPVPLIIADCCLFLKDWPGLEALVQKQDWGEANYFRLALESLARRSQGQDLASQATWRKAVHLAGHRLDSLSRLTLLSAKWGWTNEYTDLDRKSTRLNSSHW
jgi:Flp pilus assembly protein TadD